MAKKNNSAGSFFSEISLVDAAAEFAWVKGQVTHAWVGRSTTQDRVAIIEQGPRAYAVVRNRDYLARCPTYKHAAAFASRLSA
jgi:hypothetical protein